MPTTDGMAGDYGSHSEYQRRVVETGAALVTGCVDALDVPTAPEPLVFMDLGSATGRNSLVSMTTAVRAARRRDTGVPIVCVHNDLLTNDWTSLFAAIAEDADGYLAPELGPVFPTAAAGSFFSPTLPAGSVHLQMSFSAAHWLREAPVAPIRDGMYFSDARGAARREIAAQAARDWEMFVAARASDLRAGGRLIVQCVGTEVGDGVEHVTARELLAAMWAVAVGLADDGLVDAAAVADYVFPVYARTVDEAAAPFAAPGSAFEVEEIHTAAVANPYLDAWRADGDTATYARSYAAFVRGFAESALRHGLLGDRDDLVDEYFRRLEDRFRRHPEADAFRDWTLTVVARRR